MKLSYHKTWRGEYEVRFRHGNYVTHGYGSNRLQARQQVVKNVRKHIEELEAELEDGIDEWTQH